MIIQDIQRSGEGIEVKINNNNYWFHLKGLTKAIIKAEVDKIDNFDTAKFNNVKKWIGDTL